MRKSFFFHILTLHLATCFFASCDKKEKKVVVDFDELRPKPARVYEIDPDTVTIPSFKIKDISKSFRSVFQEIHQEERFFPSDAEIFPTRFGPKEYLAMTQKDDYDAEVATWYFLHFKDSIMTDNAWLNWLDCFGTSCQSIEWGSANNIIERTGQIWANDTLIVACFSRRDGSMLVKESVKIDKFFNDDIRFSLKWEQGKSGVWRRKQSLNK